MGLFAGNEQGLNGAILSMVSHGFVSAGMFLCVGVLYERYHSREIQDYRGVMVEAPRYGVMRMRFAMANLGLPGTSSFVGEILVLLGVIQVSRMAGLLGGLGAVWSAVYNLWMVTRVRFGSPERKRSPVMDLKRNEARGLGILWRGVLILGVYPELVLEESRRVRREAGSRRDGVGRESK